MGNRARVRARRRSRSSLNNGSFVPSSRRLAMVVAVGVLIDQLTKSWAVSALDGGRIIDVVWTLRFALGFNSGFAFSQGQGFGPLIGAAAVVVAVLISRAMVRATQRWSAYGLALILSGALGNVVDRVFRGDGWLHGKVVDFIDFQWFPVFNVADSCITIGAGLLIIGLFVEQRMLTQQEEASQ